MQPCPNCGGMGIDANGYCTQCRTYRGVPQPPPQPTSGTPYSGAPYGGQQQPYAGYPASSVPSYSDPISAPPTGYGATYGSTTPSGGGRNKFLMPILALSGVLVVLVVAIVVVAALKSGDDKTDPLSGPTGGATATGTGNAAKPSAAIDECLVGTWTTKTYTEKVAMDTVGTVQFSLQKNGSTLKIAPDGKSTETYKDSTYGGTPTISGQSVAITITANATVTATIATTSGSLAYSNVAATGTLNTKAPLISYDETEPFTANDDPAKYTCNGDSLSITTSIFSQGLTKSSSSY